MSRQIVIINTQCANINSLRFALHRLGYHATLTSDKATIQNAHKVFLPGVGSAKSAMANLKNLDLIECISALTQPVLGICLGMQLLAATSSEMAKNKPIDGLNIVNTHVTLLDTNNLPLPHMGWNTTTPKDNEPLFKNLNENTYFYFVHSYKIPTHTSTIATSTYGTSFSAAIKSDNFYGVQFHPERSSKAGLQLLDNFLKL